MITTPPEVRKFRTGSNARNSLVTPNLGRFESVPETLAPDRCSRDRSKFPFGPLLPRTDSNAHPDLGILTTALIHQVGLGTAIFIFFG
jgi:hypothetical protein